MEHIAIDLGGRASQVCIRDERGYLVHEARALTRSLAALLRQRGQSRAILESCTEAYRIAEAAAACGHQVRVVPATLVRTLGVGSRGIKTDRRDAQILSEVSSLASLGLSPSSSSITPSQDGIRPRRHWFYSSGALGSR